tara:strand:- start:3981 stop:4382 length:402 start_codon:yes stop_codon:yes gene_type:complete
MNTQQSNSEYGRLTNRTEYLSVRSGVKRRGKYFLLEVLDRNDLDKKGKTCPARIGFTVTKRQGNAVIRNRIRRRLKEAVRTKAHEYLLPGHDYVLVGHKELLEASFTDLIYSLEQRFINLKKPDKTRSKRVKS